MNNKKILDQSIFFIGEKNKVNDLEMEKIAKNKNLHLINAEDLINCPTDLSLIKKELRSKKFQYFDIYISAPFIDVDKEIVDEQLNEIKSDINKLKEQYNLRKRFPNVKNYKEMGYDEGFAQSLKFMYGDIAYNYYLKQFDVQLLQQIVKDLKTPVAINLGSHLTVSLDDNYKSFKTEFIKRHSGIFDRKFNESKIGFNLIQETFNDVKNVYYLNSEFNFNKRLDEHGIMNYSYMCFKSNQYKEISTKMIDTSKMEENEYPTM